MAKSIPLGATLRVQGVGIVVDHVLDELLDMMLEGLAVEGRGLGDMQWETVAASASLHNKAT